MTKRARPLRKLLLAGAVATTMTVAGCASNPAGSNGSAATSGGSPHTSHDTSSAAPALPLRAGERFVNLTMPEPYTPTAPQGGTDEYRCVILDPHLTTPTFLSGSQFQPQNTPMVHHAIVFAVPPENAAAAHAKDAATPGQGWTCFGNDGIEGEQPSAWVDTWAPGATETLLQQDVGYQLQPGSLLVLQIHYNLLATGAGATDQSSVRLRLTDGTPATKPLVTVPLSAPTELPCAAGESGPLCDRAAAIADVTQRFGAEVGGDGGRTDQRLQRRHPGAGQHPALRCPGTGTPHGVRGVRTHAPARTVDQGGTQPRHRRRRKPCSTSRISTSTTNGCSRCPPPSTSTRETPCGSPAPTTPPCANNCRN